MKGTKLYSLVFLGLISILLYSCPNNKKGVAASEVVDTLRVATLVFGGDVMQHSQQVRAALQLDGTYSYDAVFEHIKPLFDSADLAIVNLETTLADEPPFSGYPMFRSPSALAFGLAEAGVDIALLANNHVCDRGAKGMRNTLKALDSAAVRYTGAWADSIRSDYPMRFNVEGFDIRLLNYTYGTNGMPIPKGMSVNLLDTTLIASDLEHIIRSDSTIVIVAVHWGNEYQTKQSKEQELLAAWLHSHGVDIVVGGHPHVVQPIDYESNTIYSLGNLVSAQRRPNTDWGMAVKITLTRSPNIPTKIEIKPSYYRVQLPDYTIVPDTTIVVSSNFEF